MTYDFSTWYNGTEKLDFLNKVLYTWTLIMNGFTLILVALCFPLTIMDKKSFHVNFRVLRGFIIISYFTFIIGDFLFIPAVLIENNLIPEKLHMMHFVGNLLLQSSTHLLRCLWVAIFIERLIATVYSKVYENGNFWGLSIALPLIFISLAELVVGFRFVLAWNEYILHVIRICIDATGVVSLIVLYKINKRRRKIHNKSDILLTERYQISENIRVFKLIFPILAIGVTVTVLGTVLGIVNKVYPTIFNLYSYLQMLYQNLILIHILVSIFLWAKGNHAYARRLKYMFSNFRKVHVSMEPAQPQRVELKNVEGQLINKVETIDEYFKQLNDMWK